MDSQKVIYFISILVCAGAFFAFATYAFLSKKPINFWAGEKIPSDFVTDVKKYNRANGIMWLIYAICWLIAAVIGLFSIEISAGITVVLCAGIIILIIVNKLIRKKYFKNQN